MNDKRPSCPKCGGYLIPSRPLPFILTLTCFACGAYYDKNYMAEPPRLVKRRTV